MSSTINLSRKRLSSLDILRGFTMFWIIGGDQLIHSLANATEWIWLKSISKQLFHVEWNGFHFLDLIFPLFMFVAGVAIPYSIGQKLAQGVQKNTLLIMIVKRTLLLIVFGVIYNNQVSFDFPNLRYASVLGQIGVAYFIAALIFLYTNTKTQIIWIVIILLIFWGMMTLIPVPEIGFGVLTPEGNFSGYIDRLFLPGAMYREFYDPQGLLLMLSATTIVQAGAIIGGVLKSDKYDKLKKVYIMLAAGVILIGLSLIWNVWYPINKEIWSSSFNVLTIGLSSLFMGVFYFLIDIKGWTKWGFVFKIIGMNSILIYMLNRMIDFKYTSQFLLRGIIDVSGNFSNAVVIIGIISLEIYLLYFLYKQKIFLKV